MEILQCSPMKAKFLFHLNVYWFVDLQICYNWMARERNQMKSTECEQNILVLYKQNIATSTPKDFPVS